MKRLFRLGFLLVVVVPLVDSLALAVAAETGNFAGLVDIGGGRKMYLKCSGIGSPAVVLVGGLRASADDWDISNKSKVPMLVLLRHTRQSGCVTGELSQCHAPDITAPLQLGHIFGY